MLGRTRWVDFNSGVELVHVLFILFYTVALLSFVTSQLRAEIKFDGGVQPENPTDWGEDEIGYVGLQDQPGKISISKGYLVAKETYLGYESTGSLELTGYESELRTGELYIGRGGAGVAEVSGGARMYTDLTCIGWTSEGSLKIDSTQFESGKVFLGYLGTGSLQLEYNATVRLNSFYGNLADISGSGAIYAKGIVTDAEFVFDSPQDLKRVLPFGSEGIFNLDLSSGDGDLGVGYRGRGQLSIGGSVTVRTQNAYLGYLPGGQGKGVVAGSDAKLHCSQLHVGYFGEGILTIHHGAEVAAWVSYVATTNQGRGTVLVTGPGSTWKTEYDLYLGGAGAKVTIADRAVATANWVIVPAGATLELEVTHDPVVILSRKPAFGGGVREATFRNEGTVILRAATNLPPGMYTPIVARVWDDRSGIYEAIGGVWDATRHVFAVGHAANENISVNWAESRQVPIYDVNTGSYVVVEFTGGGSGSGQLSGQPASGDVLQALQSVAGAPVAAAWLFDVTNYPTGSTAWLSFFVGPGYSHDLFRYWHWDGNQWSPFNPEESSYDGGYIRFKIPGFSGYGVSIVPEPNALGILGSLAIGLAGYWWVRSRQRRTRQPLPPIMLGRSA